MTTRILEDTPRTLLVALALWAVAVAAASWAGVLAKLSPATLAALVAVAFAFATGVMFLDRGVARLFEGASLRSLFTWAVEADVLIALSAMLAVPLAQGPWAEAVTRMPLALVAFFTLPIAGALHLVVLGRLVRARAKVTSPAAKGLASRRPAT